MAVEIENFGNEEKNGNSNGLRMRRVDSMTSNFVTSTSTDLNKDVEMIMNRSIIEKHKYVAPPKIESAPVRETKIRQQQSNDNGKKNDIIKNNIYEGGVIAPGVKLSITNLYNSTALLPLIKLKNIKKSFGKNTKDALNAGFMWGYEGLINNIINKIVKINKTNNAKIINVETAPVLPSSKVVTKALGISATIPENIINEIPLPIPL